jgi:hypothetical protein
MCPAIEAISMIEPPLPLDIISPKISESDLDGNHGIKAPTNDILSNSLCIQESARRVNVQDFPE